MLLPLERKKLLALRGADQEAVAAGKAGECRRRHTWDYILQPTRLPGCIWASYFTFYSFSFSPLQHRGDKYMQSGYRNNVAMCSA